MLNVLISALASLWSYIVGPLVMQAVIYGVLYVVVVDVISYIGSKACSTTSSGDCGLSTAMSAIPSSVWYWLDFAHISYLIQVILGAYVIRFAIRRIPFFG